MNIIQEIIGDLGNGDVVNIQFVPLYKKEHEIEGAFEQGQFDFETHRIFN